jgi:hypothetical protein
VNSAGIATAKKKGGSTYIVVTAGGKSDSALVEVPTTSCGSVTPTTMAAGDVTTDIGAAGFCAAASTGDYAVIVHNTSLAGSGNVSVEINGSAVGTPPSGGASLNTVAAGGNAFGRALRTWRRDVAAEMRQRRKEALEVAPLRNAAQSWYASRPRRASLATTPPNVGDVMRVNVNISGSSCNDSTMVDARVAAVSNSAIVLADPRNPSPSFTDDEYNGFAQLFDSVINPLDVTNFGAPSDLDNNGRVLLVFTKSVNEKTPRGSSSYVGGLTHSRDLQPKSTCKASNAAEMFYLLVADSLSVVGDSFPKRFVNLVTPATIAHEYQHLINFARRTYLNPGAPQPFEELWLNEGLAHTAEELLFFRRSGRTPRTNFQGADLTSLAIYNQWVGDQAGNWLNYDEYIYRSTATSPFEAGDDISTRGATWSFLRFLADQSFSSDGAFWYDLVNSGDIGIANIRNRLNGMSTTDFQKMFRDFVVSIYVDDFVSGVSSKYTQPSWNQRSLYPRVSQISGQNFVWPLTGIALKDAETKSATLQAGGFQVYRFRGISGTDSFIRVTGASGAALPAGVTISVVRTQ